MKCFYEHTVANETIDYVDVNMRSREAYFSANRKLYSVAIDNDNSDAVTLATAPGGHIMGECLFL